MRKENEKSKGGVERERGEGERERSCVAGSEGRHVGRVTSQNVKLSRESQFCLPYAQPACKTVKQLKSEHYLLLVRKTNSFHLHQLTHCLRLRVLSEVWEEVGEVLLARDKKSKIGEASGN